MPRYKDAPEQPPDGTLGLNGARCVWMAELCDMNAHGRLCLALLKKVTGGGRAEVAADGLLFTHRAIPIPYYGTSNL